MDWIMGTDEADFLYAEGERAAVIGLAGNDTLVAGEGIDLLDGGEGADLLLGAGAGDVLIGGPGPDTHVLDGAGEGTVEIRGFEGGLDRLDLTAFPGLRFSDLVFEPIDEGTILILDDQEIVFTNITKSKLPLPSDIVFAEAVIDFDDLPTPASGALASVPGGYRGFAWAGVGVIGVSPLAPGASMPNQAAVGPLYGGTGIIARATPFELHSVVLGSGSYYAHPKVRFTGHLDGEVVAEVVIQVLDYLGPQQVLFPDPGFDQIDALTIEVFGGVQLGCCLGGPHALIDDLILP
jgi:hypothetical protein